MDQLVDLPSFTWVRQAGDIYRIMRRDGLFGQREVAMLSPARAPETQAAAARAFGAELCNVLCDYLDRKEKDRAEAEDELAAYRKRS